MALSPRLPKGELMNPWQPPVNERDLLDELRPIIRVCVPAALAGLVGLLLWSFLT